MTAALQAGLTAATKAETKAARWALLTVESMAERKADWTVGIAAAWTAVH